MGSASGNSRSWSRSFVGGLSHPRATTILYALNVLVMVAMTVTMYGSALGDHASYLSLAEGIMHGRFSPIWMEEPFVPETFRTPGYPLFLGVLLKVLGDWRLIGVVQALMYLLCLHLMVRMIRTITQSALAVNLFLLLLLPTVNIAYYNALISPEIPSLFAITALLFLDPGRHPRSWWSALVVGLLYGFLFQCRPVFLLLPVLRIAAGWWMERRAFPWRWWSGALAVYALTLLPFGLWNQHHHGKFGLTPIEGSGGVFQIGYFSGLMPHHQEWRIWANRTGDEIVRFVPYEDVPMHIAEFEHDWDRIDSACAPYLTARDSALFAEGGRRAWVWNTFSTEYTRERERWLWKLTLERVKENPWYFVKLKAWTVIRLWVIGIQRDDFAQASATGKLKQALPTALTLVQFLLFVIAVPLALRRYRDLLAPLLPALVVVIYGWFIYLPFVIQSRYTVPLRMAFLLAIAVACAAHIQRKRRST